MPWAQRREGDHMPRVEVSTGELMRSVKGSEVAPGVVKRKAGEARTRLVAENKLGGGRFAAEVAGFKGSSSNVDSSKQALAKLEAIFPPQNKPNKETEV